LNVWELKEVMKDANGAAAHHDAYFVCRRRQIISRLVVRAGRPSCMSARQTVLNAAAHIIHADPENSTTWRHCCTTFTGCESVANHVSAGGFGVPLSEWTYTTLPCWRPTPGRGSGVTSTAAFGGNCGTDRPSHGAFYDRRSRLLRCSRSVVKRSCALCDVINVSSSFRKNLKTVLLTGPFPS